MSPERDTPPVRIVNLAFDSSPWMKGEIDTVP
jgi:hypothetical protein